jgi:hypothetical protein
VPARRVRRLAVALAVLGGSLAGGVSAASAHGLITGFADSVYLSPNAATRAHWLGRSKQEDAGILRFNVSWRGIASAKPTHPRNPGDPAYDFGKLDAGVIDARSRGFRVMLTVFGAPAWAVGKNAPGNVAPGTWKPKRNAFGDFAHAIASRYSGHYVTGSATKLPRVPYFEAWNEPNLADYLTPQWHGKKPVGPKLYRGLLNAFFKGVKSGQHGATVIGGATAPVGDPPGGNHMRPITFLDNLFCLKKHCKHFQKPKLDVLSAHPITSPGVKAGPHAHAAIAADTFVADFSKVRNVLHAAQRKHHIAGGSHHGLWATEFWWITNPPNKHYGVSWSKQAKWINVALYLLWKQGAQVAINFAVKDTHAFGSGVFSTKGKAKPSARAFRFPFVVTGHKHKAGVWGKPPRSGRLAVQRKKHGKWQTVKSFKVKRGKVFRSRVGASRSAKLRAKIGNAKSLTSSASTSSSEQKRLSSPALPAPGALAPYIENAR